MRIRVYPIDDLGLVKEIKGRIVEMESVGDSLSEFVLSSGEEQKDELREGKMIRVYVNKFERNKVAREKCIEHYGAICKACKFDFSKKYGEIGRGYIEVHHIVPLSETRKEDKVDPIKDLIPVCSNCHAMLHHKGTSDIDMTVEQLEALIKQNEK